MENVCRTCLRMPDKFSNLFEDASLPYKIATISSVRVEINDDLPKLICEECVKNVNLSYNFRKVIINSDLDLKERYAALKNTFNNEKVAIDDEHHEDDIPFNDETLSLDPPKYETVMDNVEVKCLTKVEQETTTPAPLPKLLVTKEARAKPKFTFKNVMMYNKKRYYCKECDFTCTELSKWQNHKRTNHYARGVCNVCGKTIRYDNLQKHINSHSEEPVPCKDCGKIMKNSESLRCHAIVHNGKKYTCNICGKIYTYRGEYNRHLKKHATNGQKTVKCPMCDKLFYDTKYIKKHIRSHTGERPYLCQYCKKGFSSSYALKTHIRRHTNEKPYICEYCPMAFPQKVSLMTHIKSKHSNRKE